MVVGLVRHTVIGTSLGKELQTGLVVVWHTDWVGDLAGSLDGPGVAHPPSLSMAVGGRGVTSNKRGSTCSVSSSVESVSIGLSLTFAKVVVDQTSSSIADGLNASSNTSNTSNTDSSSRGDSNASNTG